MTTRSDALTLTGSATLRRALEILDGMHVVVREDSGSPWIELDVDVRGFMRHFGIWKTTDVIYAEESIRYADLKRMMEFLVGPAMGEDPYDVELLAELVAEERR
jgi:hypothetical protein